MRRRDFMRLACMSGAALPAHAWSQQLSPATASRNGETPLRVLHITDVHIRPEEQATERCATLLEVIRREAGPIDFVLNTGDSVYAADYEHITRERMLLQWDLWDSVVMGGLVGQEVISCLGNHDSWWAAPTEDDAMRGKEYAARRVGMPARYHAVDKGPWRIIALDSNNEGVLDNEQRLWLDRQVADLAEGRPALIMSHRPVLTCSSVWDGMESWQEAIIDPLYDGSRRVCFISGHTHELESMAFENLAFHCNGALSGHWWEPGPEEDGTQNGTPIGFAVLELFADGRVTCEYRGFTRDELLRM